MKFTKTKVPNVVFESVDHTEKYGCVGWRGRVEWHDGYEFSLEEVPCTTFGVYKEGRNWFVSEMQTGAGIVRVGGFTTRKEAVEESRKRIELNGGNDAVEECVRNWKEVLKKGE